MTKVGDRLQVTFEEGRNGSPMTRVNGKISFPERGGKLPKVGETWEVELAGTNPKGTVHFLRLIRRVEQAVESAAKTDAGPAPAILTGWRLSDEIPVRILADARTGTSFEVREFDLNEVAQTDCPTKVVELARQWQDRVERGRVQWAHAKGFDLKKWAKGQKPRHFGQQLRFSDDSNASSHNGFRGLAGQESAHLVGSLNYGASRSTGSGWLVPNTRYTINTAIERPRVGTDGEGRSLVELPLGWGFFAMTGRGLSVQVLDQDEGVVVQSAKNAFALLAPFGKGANLSVGWFKKAGKWSRSFEWQGRVVVTPEGVDYGKAAPAPTDM